MSRLTDLVTSPERRQVYLERGLWDDATLPGRVAAHAVDRPDATAVVDRDGAARHSYGDLQREVSRFAGWLLSEGVQSNDVVSVQLPNCYEFAVVAVAALAVGAVVNPLLPVYRRRELAHVVAVARPKVICTPATYRGFDHVAETRALLEQTAATAAHVVVSDDRPGTAGRPPVWYPEAHGEGPALLDPDAAAVSEVIFTSGTEARPKAVMHTEQTANFSVRAAREHLGIGDADVVWMPSPLGHSTGFNYGMRFALYHGLPLVLQDRWDPAVGYDLISAYGASYTLASTTFLLDVVAEAERRGGTLPSMRLFGCGGATVPPQLVARAAARSIGVLRLYGSTEVLVATWNRPEAAEADRVCTDGQPLDHVDVEVRDEAGAVCPDGAPGEIFVRGPNTCVGFYDDPERTVATFSPEGWVRSGDLATVADGSLSVVGRRKEIIIRGGLNITPRDVEDLLIQLPEVQRAAVVGLPDERLGEKVCACVVLAPGSALDFDTMVQRLREAGLASFKLPERLELLEELPTTASGKVQKFEIVNRLIARPGAER